jgi:hypothetical protein
MNQEIQPLFVDAMKAGDPEMASLPAPNMLFLAAPPFSARSMGSAWLRSKPTTQL